MKRPAMAHQLRMINFGLARKTFAFYCEMGTGKSQPIINIFTALKFEKKVSHCLIICPKSVVDSWVNEIKINSGHSYEILTGTKKKRLAALDRLADFYIINYEGMLVMADASWDKIDMVVLDESQKINNHAAKRTKLILKLFARRNCYKALLSGTPIDKNPLGLYTQFYFLNPDIFNQGSFYAFRNTYAIMENQYLNRGGRLIEFKQIIGFKNLDNLKEKIKPWAIQLKKAECLDLPEKIYETKTLEMPEELKKQYQAMKEELVVWFSENEYIAAANALVKIGKLRQILSGVFLEKKTDNLKLKEIIDIVDNTVESIIIWAYYIDSIKLLQTTLEERGEKCSMLYGAIKDRAEQIELFQSGKNKIFIGQIETGGLGITLTKASQVIYFENTFRLEDRLQSEDRAHRKGQINKVLYTDFVYKNTIDEHIIRAIRDKQEIADQVIDCFTGTRVNIEKKKEKRNGKQEKICQCSAYGQAV